MRRTVIDVYPINLQALLQFFLYAFFGSVSVSIGRPWLRGAFGAVLSIGTAAVGAFFGPSTAVSAGVGHLVFVLLALGLSHMASPAVGWAAICAGATVALLLEMEALPAGLAGAAAGATAWRLAFWEQLVFLDAARPLAHLRHQIDEALNVFIRSDRARWDRMYARGQWECLRGQQLAPLYAETAEFLRRGAPSGARIVDLGCGNGALLSALRGWHKGYLGVDLSATAVARCRLAGLLPGEELKVQSIEEFDDFADFDAAVFNEVLYYLSVDRAVQAVRCAVADLRRPGIAVVVMTDNPKTRAIWAALDRWHPPEEKREFRAIQNEPPCELRSYLAPLSVDLPPEHS